MIYMSYLKKPNVIGYCLAELFSQLTKWLFLFYTQYLYTTQIKDNFCLLWFCFVSMYGFVSCWFFVSFREILFWFRIALYTIFHTVSFFLFLFLLWIWSTCDSIKNTFNDIIYFFLILDINVSMCFVHI